jgi:hypothetical protein
MKLSKALKVKNRLVGEINTVKSIINRENSQLEDKFNHTKVSESFVQLDDKLAQLISLKAAIQVATAPIAVKLIRMAELKGQLGFFECLDTKEGKFSKSRFTRDAPEEYDVFEAFVTQDDVDARLQVIKEEINDLQDEVDDFNATTSI